MAQNFSYFHTYEVLEPVKAPENPDRDVVTLINLCDDQSKQDILELSGSDLDNVKKSEFDLVDLFQNIYVTPQHIRKEKKVVECPHIDYSEFFQKLEAGHKMDTDMTSNASTFAVSSLNTTDARDTKCEEDEEEKEHFHIEQPSFEHNILKAYDITKVLKVPIVKNLSSEIKHISETKTGNATGYNKSNKSDNSCINGYCIPTNVSNVSNVKTFNGTSSTDGSFHSNHVSIHEKLIKNNDFTKSSLQSAVQNQNMLQNCLTDSCNNNQPRAVIEKLKTVTLDKKTYTKQLQIKSDMQKLGYTKGPDHYEKSVVLPQIMNRLVQRKVALSEEAGLTRRLILDSSIQSFSCNCQHSQNLPKSLDTTNELVQDRTKPASIHAKLTLTKKQPTSSLFAQNVDTNLNPIVALRDCNRERLLAHRVHSAFQKYILTGSYY